MAYRGDAMLRALWTDATCAIREVCEVAGVKPRLRLEALRHEHSAEITRAQEAGDEDARRAAMRQYLAARGDAWEHQLELVVQEVDAGRAAGKAPGVSAKWGSIAWIDALAVVARFAELSLSAVRHDASV